MWAYFVDPDLTFPYVHTNLFGGANYTSLSVTGILAMLLTLSNDPSLRRLGTARWKQLQRWNYAGFVLVLLHRVAYQLIEKRELPYVLLFGSLLLLVITVQIAGFWQRRRHHE
jgi:DMSO/TMAO reductase YedYZ heme-binding membrane subunit